MAILKPGQLASGSYTISGSFSGSFQGSGAGLNNIPSSAIVGLGSTQIASGAVTASVSTGTGSFTVNSGSSTFMFISSSGNVGIGTSSPTNRLEVQGGDVRFQNALTIGTVGLSGWQFSSNTLTLLQNGFLGVDVAGGRQFSITNTAFSTTYFQIASTTGNVLINTTTDAGFKLDVNGTARVKGVGSTNATTAFTIINSSGSELLTISDSNISTFAGGNGRIVTNVIRLNYINSANDNYTIMQLNGSTGNAKFYQGISIGTSSDPVASAQVEIVSPTKGFLPPRTNLTSNISTPAQGLITYLTGSTNEGLYYYNSGSAIGWHKVLTNSGSQDISGSLNLTGFATGSVLFTSGSTGTVTGSANLFWDNTNEIFNVVGRINAKSTTAQPSSLIVEGTTGVNSGNAGFVVRTGTGYQATFFAADSLAGQGIAGLGIFSGNATPFGLQTGAPNGAFFIHNNGNIGIGTNYTNAGFRLDVNGTARVQDNVLLTNGIIATSAGTTRLQSSLNYFSHQRLASSGAFGWDIRNSAGTQIAFWNYDAGSGNVNFGGTVGTPLLLSTNNTTRATITVGGNVLINTTTDTGHKLTVSGSGTSGSLNVDNTLYVSGSRVGVGTSAPVCALDITGNVALVHSGTRGKYYFSRDAVVLYPTKYYADGGDHDVNLVMDNSNKISLYDNAQSTWNTNWSIGLLGGNVLINTTTDAGYKLDVNGTARVVTSILVGAGSGTGTVQTGVCRATYFNSYANNFTIFETNNSTGNAKFYQGVSVGTSSDPVASAQVEIVSTTKGFLPPRTNLTSNISTPAQGLITYLTGSTNEGLYYYNSGSAVGWHKILTNSGSQEVSGSLVVSGSLDVNGSARVQSTLGVNGSVTANLASSGTGYEGYKIQDGGTTRFVAERLITNFLGIGHNSISGRWDDVLLGSAQRLYFYTGASERMRIFSTGNVGINTTTDAGYLLDVNGTARATSINIVDGSTILDRDGSLLRVHGTNGIKLTTWNAGYLDALTVQATTGNVGIGTSTPSASLHVSGAAIIDGGLYDTLRTGSLPTGSTLLYSFSTGSYTAGFFDYYTVSGSNFRAGTIISVAGANTYKFTDTATPDIGDTTNLQFSMSLSANNLQLYASASSAGWTVKTTFRTI